MACDLARAEVTDSLLRRAERGRPGLHIGVREERAEDHGAAGADRLDEGDPGERFRDLLRERRRDRDRRHRAHQQEGRHDRRLVRLRVLEQGGEHPVVVAQRRVDVDQRDDRRRLLDRLAPEHELRHRDRVRGVRARGDRAHERLVRERQQRVDHVQVARVERLVVRLADRSPGRVELREGLREPDEVLEVGVRRVAALEAFADEGAAVDRRENHVVPAEVDAPLRVPGLELELGRRFRDLLEDPVRIEPDELALDLLAFAAEVVERLFAQELDPELADDAAPAAVELGQRRLVEDLVPRHRVDQHRASSRSRSSAASSPRSPVLRTSSGSPSRAAARSALRCSSGVGSCASQTTRS